MSEIMLHNKLKNVKYRSLFGGYKSFSLNFLMPNFLNTHAVQDERLLTGCDNTSGTPNVKEFQKEQKYGGIVTTQNANQNKKQINQSFKQNLPTSSNMSPLNFVECKLELPDQNIEDDHSYYLQADTPISDFSDNTPAALDIEKCEKERQMNEIKSHESNLTKNSGMFLLKNVDPKRNIELLNQLNSSRGPEKYYCDQCDYSTQYQHYIKRHKFKHLEKKQHRCEECGYSTINYCHLKLHKLNHSKQKLYQCDECNYATNLTCNLRVHKLKHTKKKQYKCDQCTFATHYLKNLKKHVIRHSRKLHQAAKASQNEKSNMDITSGNTNEPKQLPISLKKSDSSASSESLLVKLIERKFTSDDLHQNTNIDNSHVKVETHNAHSCDNRQDISLVEQTEKETTRNEVISLQNTKEIKQPRQRAKPNLTACLEMLLLKHVEPKCNIETLDQKGKAGKVKIKKPRDKEKYRCDECEYSTKYQYYIKRHKLKHSEKKIHPCDECNYSTVNYSHLKLHKLNHSGKKQHHCDECSYATNMLSNLRVHKVKHMPVKKYKCKQCEFTTKYHRYLKQHAIRHQGK